MVLIVVDADSMIKLVQSQTWWKSQSCFWSVPNRVELCACNVSLCDAAGALAMRLFRPLIGQAPD